MKSYKISNKDMSYWDLQDFNDTLQLINWKAKFWLKYKNCL